MFAQLLDNPGGRHSGTVQSEAAARFPEVVAGSPLRLRNPQDAMAVANVIILGVASYSRDELKLLDQLVANADRWKDRLTIYVFDVTARRSLKDFDQCLRNGLKFGPRVRTEDTPALHAKFIELAFTCQGMRHVTEVLEYADVLTAEDAA